MGFLNEIFCVSFLYVLYALCLCVISSPYAIFSLSFPFSTYVPFFPFSPSCPSFPSSPFSLSSPSCCRCSNSSSYLDPDCGSSNVFSRFSYPATLPHRYCSNPTISPHYWVKPVPETSYSSCAQAILALVAVGRAIPAEARALFPLLHPPPWGVSS